MGTPTNIHALTATQVQERIANGDLTLVQYVTALLDRYKAREEHVQAWAAVRPEQDLLDEARRMDALEASERGRLHGFVVGVKDVIMTRDMSTKYNSPLHESDYPLLDASTVAMLRRNGALIMGKTQTSEFSATAVTPGTGNPHDPSRSPGGSSSGSAAAVADMHIPIGLGTQTIGSVIRPASFNGIFGLKPTWNAVSSEGQKVTAPTLDTFGLMARCVGDLQRVADVLGLQDDEEAGEVCLGESRFAVVKPPAWSEAGQGTVSAMENAVELLRSSGAQVEHVTLPEEFRDILSLQSTVLRHEAGVAFLRERGEPTISSELAEFSRGIEGAARRRRYLRALDALAALRPKMDDIAGRYTAVLTASAGDVAPKERGWTGESKFNAMWTALHTPVINIPGFAGEDGMPVGVSLVAPRYRDRHLLQVAAAVGPLFEEKGGWRSKLG